MWGGEGWGQFFQTPTSSFLAPPTPHPSPPLTSFAGGGEWRERGCCRKKRCRKSLQRLDAHENPVVVHVPDRHRIGGVVDPGAPVVRDRLGQDVFGPAVGLGI